MNDTFGIAYGCVRALSCRHEGPGRKRKFGTTLRHDKNIEKVHDENIEGVARFGNVLLPE